MGNGGSPPAHLPLSSLSKPEVWPQIKLSQPSPLLTWEEMQQEDERRLKQYKQAWHARQEAADARTREALAATHACQEAAFAHLQQLLAEEAAQARQEAAAACARQEDERRRQQLLDKQAACARQEAAAARARQEADDAHASKALALDVERHRHEAVLAAEPNDNAEDEYKDVARQFFARVDATMAKIQAMDDGFENLAAAQEKVLADKATSNNGPRRGS